jgi:alpha-1,6-mannosyltransferase
MAIAWLYGIPRDDFYTLWSIYALAFAAYVWLVFGKAPISLRNGLLLAFLIRFISLWFDPLLSDDYYRFIWDGMVLHHGVHPMAYTPAYLMSHPEIMVPDQSLFSRLNSPAYYSVYPPVSQWLFRLSFAINGMHIAGHILFYKVLLIATDILIVFLLYRLLIRLNQPSANVLWYALNPLIIMEFTGNLHMDGLMIAGLLGAVVLAEQKSILAGSFMMAFSMLSKLLTLILIPFMPRQLYWRKITLFTLSSLAMSAIILLWSFGSNTGWLESVHLWFTSFEFNASLYYVARSIGYYLKGYNAIATIGPILAVMTMLSIGIIWLWYIRSRKPDWSSAMLCVMTVYFLMSTTVHPWYLGVLVALGVLSGHRYPIAWTFLVFLSYSHYADGHAEENYWLIATEYCLLLAWMVWEWRFGRKTDSLPSTTSPAN